MKNSMCSIAPNGRIIPGVKTYARSTRPQTRDRHTDASHWLPRDHRSQWEARAPTTDPESHGPRTGPTTTVHS